MKKTLLILILALSIFTGLNAQVVPNPASVYPNPATSSIRVSFATPVKSDVTITISDILGNKIGAFKFTADEAISIDLSNLDLKNGMYLVKVETGDQSQLKRLVVKS
jgi:hypothetical protein